MVTITGIDKDRMTFATDGGDEYPLFDESVDSSILNEMLPVAEQMIKDLKNSIWKKC